MTGAQLLGLLMKAEIGGRDSGLDRLGTVADNHMDGGRAEGPGSIEHMFKQWLARQPMQDLGLVGAHTRPLARGQYDDFQFGVLAAHDVALQSELHHSKEARNKRRKKTAGMAVFAA